MRVLYVEDNVLDAELACRELSKAAPPIEVDLVESIEEAVDRLERGASDYDLVLSDLGLPDGDGLALLAHIRELDLPLAVVITTGAGDERTVVAALRAGADDYVVKGADYMAHLAAVLEGALERFRAVHARRSRSLRVLYAEDNEMDAELARHYVARHAPYIHLDVVDSPERVYQLLAQPTGAPYDLLLLDYRLPGANGLDVLRELRQVHGLDIPVVLITGQGDEEIARQAMGLGAADYVVKRGEYVQSLPFVLENAFQRAQLVREQVALRESEERYRGIVELAPDGILTMSLLGVITSCNSAFLELTGFDHDEIVGLHFTKLPTLRLAEIPAYAELFAQIVQGTFGGPFEFKWYHKSGTQRWGEARFSLVREGSVVTGIQIIVADISERKRAERLLQALNRAALAMERALTPDEIFAAVAQEFGTLGIYCAVFLVDERQDVLVPKYLRYLPGTVEAVEKLLGIDATQLPMPLDAVDVLRQVVRERETTFFEDVEGAARDLLPRPLKRFAGQVVKMVEVSRVIAAPLVVEDRVVGLLSVQSADLIPDDVPAITAFAHQMAAAWRRAQLYEQARQEITERRRMAGALRESEQRFRHVFENAPIGIYRTTPDGSILMANPALVRMLGYNSFEELAQLDLERRGSPEYDRAEFKRRLEREGQIIGLEAVWTKKDGTPLYIRENATVVRDGDGDVAYYDGTIENITERKRAEQLLQTLNQAALAMGNALTPKEVFAAVAEELEKVGCMCTILPIDSGQGRVFARHVHFKGRGLEAAEKLVGLSHESFSFDVEDTEPYRRVIAEKGTVFVEDTESVLRQVLPAPAKTFAQQIAALIGYDRSIASPLLVEDQVIGVLSVGSSDLTRDDMPAITAFAHQVSAAWRRAQLYEQAQIEIAERMRAEEALRASEDRFRTLVQNSSDAIVVLEADGIVRYISPSIERILGYPPDFFVGKNPFGFVHPADVASLQDGLAAAVQQPGEPIPHGFRIRHVDGSWVSLDTLINNLLHIPSVGGLVVNARDVTERTRLEQQFLQAQKMEAVGRLAGGIAHDFNNLLTAMQGYTSLLLSDLGSDRPLDESWKQAMRADLTEIKLAADRAAGLTQQLLAFSRRQVLQPRVLDLSGLVRSMENMLQRLIGEDIELDTALAPSLGSVLADPGQIEQVIMNLVVNARDAMPQGGRLAIRTANVELDEAYTLEHPGSRPGTYVLLSVSDTGIGMGQEVLSHLFEPFFTTKADGKGTGLGLATVYGIVKQSGGYIWPQSGPGQGTTFQIYLPRVEDGVELQVEQAKEPGALLPGTETVLLVEDEEIVRELARRILDRQGYSVLTAGHPEEALQLCDTYAGQIDLLITDVVMPGMSGRDLSDRLLLSRPKTKVLFVSGYTDDAIAQHGVLDPEVNFIQKPFRPSDLAQRVREVLDGE